MPDAALPPPRPPSGGADRAPVGSLPPPTVPPPPPPPGYVPYRTGPAPTAPLTRVRGLARWIVAAVALAGVVAVASTGIQLALVDDARDLLAGRIDETEFERSLRSSQLVSAVSSVLTIGAGIVTVAWMHRVSRNLRSLGRRTTWAPIMAVIGWLLPPFLYVIPLLVVRELWKASDPAVPVGDDGWRAGRTHPAVWVWWVAYGALPAIVTAVTIGSVIGAFFEGDPGATALTQARSLDAGAPFVVPGVVAAIVAAVAWIVVVRALTDRHTTLTAEGSTGDGRG